MIYLIIIKLNQSNTFYNEIVPPPTAGYQVANCMVWLKSADYLFIRRKKSAHQVISLDLWGV